MSETYEETLGDNCKHCLAPIAVRNPTGTCDHLCWPDYLTPEAKLANGIPLSEIERLRSLLEDLVRAVEPFAELMERVRFCHPSFDSNPDDAALDVFYGDDPTPAADIKFGDLRTLLKAYLKAKPSE